jgi:hypothetical protein
VGPEPLEREGEEGELSTDSYGGRDKIREPRGSSREGSVSQILAGEGTRDEEQAEEGRKKKGGAGEG